MASEATISVSDFTRRFKAFQSQWQSSGGWGEVSGVTGVVVVAGTSDNDQLRYLKSGALQLWLFGYEFPETAMAFTQKDLWVLTSSKKAGVLRPLTEVCEAECQVKLHLLVREKGSDGTQQAAEILQGLKDASPEPVLGLLSKEAPEGKVADAWAAQQQSSGLQTADIAPTVAALLAAKDQTEVTHLKRAAFLGARVMKDFVVTQIETIIDEEKKVKHSKLSEMVDAAILDPGKLNIKLNKEKVDYAFNSLVQSGGTYDLKLGAAGDSRNLQYDIILCSLGTRYSMYCATCARTYLVDPSKQQEQEYGALLAAQAAALNALVHGAPFSAVHEAVTRTLQEKGQGHLVDKLPKSLGNSMGLELRESGTALNAKNSAPAQAGMVFNLSLGALLLKPVNAPLQAGTVFDLSLGAAGLQRAAEGTTTFPDYAFLVSDTVLVKEQGPAEVLSSACPSSWAEVAYYFKQDTEQEPAEAEGKGGIDPELAAGAARTNLRSDESAFRAQEELRRKSKQAQDALLQKVNEDTLKSLTQAKDSGPSGDSGRKVSEVVSYRSHADVPIVRDYIIQVDQASETVLVPLYGVMVPFHILMVRNISSSQEGDHAYIRLNFNFGPSFEPCAKHPTALFLKELSFRTADSRHSTKVVQEVKALRTAVTQRERERAERATLVQQESLIKAKGRMFTLPDVWIRPNFGGKGRKMTGQLEAHANGFRYSTPKGESLDIMYRNIKHAFFQPAKGEMIVLLHFRLKNPIMLNKRKVEDVQCYAEVMDTVQTLDAGRRSMYDPDELEDEQRERELRSKVNKQFLHFTKRVQQEIWEREFGDLDLEFEVPFRELVFDGVPHRSAAKMMPTVNCLVELQEMPFTVITLTEVAIVSLERVGFNLRNLDMAVVFKDLARDVFRIDAIPSTALDNIRDWLTNINVKFYESKINLNWKPILKNIMEDPEGFVEDGGWDFLNQEADGSGEEDEEEEGDAEFAPSGSEAEDESEEEGSSDQESLASEGGSSDAADGSEDEDEESGMSWDELEKEAEREDRARAGSDSDGEDGGRKRKGASSKAPISKKSRR